MKHKDTYRNLAYAAMCVVISLACYWRGINAGSVLFCIYAILFVGVACVCVETEKLKDGRK